ncbi:MAG: carboxypeptidase-like regulatory domain-containing protein [Bryobacteraceae bacterium]
MSDDTGYYEPIALPPGLYVVTAEEGFQKQAQTGVALTTGQSSAWISS